MSDDLEIVLRVRGPHPFDIDMSRAHAIVAERAPDHPGALFMFHQLDAECVELRADDVLVATFTPADLRPEYT